MKHILKTYEENSGQKINLDKLALFFSWNIIHELRRKIKDLFGVQSKKNMRKYLGIPTLVGKDRKRTFRDLKERMTVRARTWSNKTLSQGGKEVFIKSILQSIPIYIMSCFLLPKTYVKSLIPSLKTIGGDITKEIMESTG